LLLLTQVIKFLQMSINKNKIFNDPVYGFITLPSDLVFDIIEHPWFQRLRRIRQLGLTHMVYPGALHTRFHHALGALHLMTEAIESIKSKGHEITKEEETGAYIAILLHDIGHGPFSHALENSIVTGLSHETLSNLIMEKLNNEFNGQLSIAIEIFKNTYKKKFLHQLVSSQLDMDRLDYLNRDSFYTGVMEGTIGSQRIIKMLNVFNDELVVDEKGLYSIEKFIIARRLMYWQVYLHKTVLSAENMLVNILKRAKELYQSGEKLFTSPALEYFLKNNINAENIQNKEEFLNVFSQLDDYDIYCAIKVWCGHSDIVLSTLCKGMINRKLYKISLQRDEFDAATLSEFNSKISNHWGIKEEDYHYFAFTGNISNSDYNPLGEPIKILMRNQQGVILLGDNEKMDVAILSTPVNKYFFCYMPELAV
jgi:HD superfamily phosphohydrolase